MIEKASLEERDPGEECGVFGVWAPGEDVAKLTYFGLFALQHRGQEGAGIGVGNGDRIVVYKDEGLVSQVFDEALLNAFDGDIAVGHTRYTTAGPGDWGNIQPIFTTAVNGTDIAVGHNGNLVNVNHMRSLVDAPEEGSDTTVLTHLLASRMEGEKTLGDAAKEVLPEIRGAFCLVMTDGNTLYAARDTAGVRPLALGRLERGWVVASETCALDLVGASYVRDIEPGEIVTIDAPVSAPKSLASQSVPPVSSSMFTWPARTPWSMAVLCRLPASQSGVPWLASIPLKQTWSCPCPSPETRRLLVTPRNPGFRLAMAL